MTATLRMGLDASQVRKGFSELAGDYNKLVAKGYQLRDVMSAVGKEMDSRKLAAFNSEVRRLADQHQGLGPGYSRSMGQVTEGFSRALGASAQLTKGIAFLSLSGESDLAKLAQGASYLEVLAVSGRAAIEMTKGLTAAMGGLSAAQSATAASGDATTSSLGTLFQLAKAHPVGAVVAAVAALAIAL